MKCSDLVLHEYYYTIYDSILLEVQFVGYDSYYPDYTFTMIGSGGNPTIYLNPQEVESQIFKITKALRAYLNLFDMD